MNGFSVPRSFQAWVNTFVIPTGHHRTLGREGAPQLPLPPQTAFRFRSAERSATYFTRLPEQAVVAHFEGMGSATPAAPSAAGGVRLLVLYEGVRFEIVITPEGGGHLLRVTALDG